MPPRTKIGAFEGVVRFSSKDLTNSEYTAALSSSSAFCFAIRSSFSYQLWIIAKAYLFHLGLLISSINEFCHLLLRHGQKRTLLDLRCPILTILTAHLDHLDINHSNGSRRSQIKPFSIWLTLFFANVEQTDHNFCLRSSNTSSLIPFPSIFTTWRFVTGGVISITFSRAETHEASNSFSIHNVSLSSRLETSSSHKWGYFLSFIKFIKNTNPFVLIRLSTSNPHPIDTS